MTHEAGELPEQGARRLLDQTLEFWIRPEVERRSQAKLLPNGFQLLAGQVLFDLDAGAPRVRINEEVRALASVRTPQPLTPGEPVMSNQVDEFVHIELTDDDPNEGHITLVRPQGGLGNLFQFSI
jgi:hypothetical protein